MINLPNEDNISCIYITSIALVHSGRQLHILEDDTHALIYSKQLHLQLDTEKVEQQLLDYHKTSDIRYQFICIITYNDSTAQAIPVIELLP